MAKARGYTEGDWRGQVLYVCERCPFDSFDEARIRTHVAEHPKPRPSAARTHSDEVSGG